MRGSYLEPDPAAGPTARVTVLNRNAENPLAGVASTTLHLYAVREGCASGSASLRDAYLGAFDVHVRERSFRVVAGMPVFVQLVYSEQNDEALLGCRGYVGFVPRRDEAYTLELRIDRHSACDAALGAAHGAVELLEPTTCFGP